MGDQLSWLGFLLIGTSSCHRPKEENMFVALFEDEYIHKTFVGGREGTKSIADLFSSSAISSTSW